MSITNTEISLLIKLFMAHMLSDYFLQMGSWVSDKVTNGIKSPRLYLHILITFICAWLFSGSFWAALFIGVTHYVIDLGKIYIPLNRFILFALDQFLHVVMLLLAWLWLTDNWTWLIEETQTLFDQPSTWVILFSYLVITFPLSIVIDIFVHKWRAELTTEKQESLLHAGHWIGVLERVLVLTFVLLGQFSAMGFLIATKAILRFKDTEIKQMEYVLIGTLMSLTPTILLGIISQYLLNNF